MKPEWRRFAPLGLWLALLAAIAAAGLYIVQRAWNLPLQICLALIVVGLALFAILDPERVRLALTGRQARYGSNALVLSVAFVGTLVVVNYLVYQNGKRWDLTEDKQFTLAPETLNTLKELPQNVQALAFYTQRTPSDQAKNLLEQYKFRGNDKFNYQFIDPEAQPVLAQQNKVTRDGTVVLVMGNRQEQVSNVTEQDVTGALVKLLNPQASTLYFLTGHGEYSPDDSGERGYSQVKNALEAKNYTVKTLNLLADNKIPDDAKVIIIPGPTKPLSQAEVDLLNQYAAKGGALLVMEEPLPVTQFGDSPDPLAGYLSQTWGISLGKDIVIDQTAQQPFNPFANTYGDHPITQKMQRISSVFPSARSVTASSADTGVSQTQLVLTSPQSWAETDLKSLQDQSAQIQFNQGQDTQGPVSLAVAAENFQSKGRVVAFGDLDFASDNAFSALANGDLFVNAVDWAAGQENLINLTPKPNTQRTVIPPQKATMNLVLLGTVFVIPGLVLLAGVSAFIQRRKRG